MVRALLIRGASPSLPSLREPVRAPTRRSVGHASRRFDRVVVAERARGRGRGFRLGSRECSRSFLPRPTRVVPPGAVTVSVSAIPTPALVAAVAVPAAVLAIAGAIALVAFARPAAAAAVVSGRSRPSQLAILVRTGTHGPRCRFLSSAPRALLDTETRARRRARPSFSKRARAGTVWKAREDSCEEKCISENTQIYDDLDSFPFRAFSL